MQRIFTISLCLATLLAGSVFAGGLSVGSDVPDFGLKTADGGDVSYADVAGDITVVTFIATKCPVSNNYNERFQSIYADYKGKGVKFVHINSNKAELGPEVKQHAADNGFEFTVYKDPGNVVADIFGAERTPETYVIKGGKVVYHGRIDDAQKGEIKVHSLRGALDAVLAGKTPDPQETRAFGCTIKRVNAS